MMLKRIVSAGALVLLLVQPTAAAETAKVYARPGATTAQITAAQDACKPTVKKVMDYAYLGAPPGDYSMEGVAGAAIASLIVGAVRTASARDRAMIICMRKTGFAYLPLNAEEDAAYAKLAEGPARDAWLDGFLAAVPEARIAEALRPVHPPLPSSAPAPFLAGPVRLQAESLKLAQGTIRYGEPLLTARATRRATATVKAPADVGVLPPTILRANGIAQAGAIFHLVDYFGPPSAAEEDRTMWCGPVETTRGQKLVCVTSHFTGQRVAVAKGPAVLAAPDPDYATVRLEARTPLTLEPLPPETDPVFDVGLKANLITKKYVNVVATATRDKKTSHVWAGSVDFDAGGRAVLPFWDRSLVITRVEKGVTVAFEPRSDGLGWYDELPKAAQQKAD